MGYAGVEPAGFPGTTVKDAAKLFRELGLTVCGMHSAAPIGDKKAEVLDTAAMLGCKRIVTGKGPDDFKTRDLIQKTCEEFNRASQAARENGLTLSLHNHWWEFEELGAFRVYEYMLDDLDKDVLFEIDVYWVQVGGRNPARIVRKLAGRSPLHHIKDGRCSKGEPMTAVGDGFVDIPGIAKVTKADWWIVELDTCATDMMEAVRKSAAYLTSKGFVRGKL
jgi:sugar phosphate isomerase/epimerase